ERPHPCPWCGKSFLRRQDQRRHVLAHAYDTKRFSCTGCGKRFTRSDALFRH
ncbi:hypothetical protein CXG81DRAFT_7940, partial [Caulochytrium protostelioides]